MSADAEIHYYIYYRIRNAIDADDAQASVRAMQAALAKRTGVTGRLLRRAHDTMTWMEIYEGVTDPNAFEAALRAETESHRLDALVDTGGVRHIERFSECV